MKAGPLPHMLCLTLVGCVLASTQVAQLQTQCGPINGIVDTDADIASFLGIPYAGKLTKSCP